MAYCIGSRRTSRVKSEDVVDPVALSVPATVLSPRKRARGSDLFPKTEAGTRTFGTGATRDLDANKLDFEGFLSPLVLERYAEHMHKARKMPDGSVRDSDNWQLGIPVGAYMKSLWRHFFDVWKTHRGYATVSDIETELCGVLFNANGMLHEILKAKLVPSHKSTDSYGTTYHIEAAPTVKTPGAKFRPGCPSVEVWWSRDGVKADETLIIRQEYEDRNTADVLELTFGQVYDLIDALNRAVEAP
jgi:hypothetical protein